MNWQTLGDRWVFDAVALITMAGLNWHSRILRRWSKRLEKNWQELGRRIEELGRWEASLRERDGRKR